MRRARRNRLFICDKDKVELSVKIWKTSKFLKIDAFFNEWFIFLKFEVCTILFVCLFEGRHSRNFLEVRFLAEKGLNLYLHKHTNIKFVNSEHICRKNQCQSVQKQKKKYLMKISRKRPSNWTNLVWLRNLKFHTACLLILKEFGGFKYF